MLSGPTVVYLHHQHILCPYRYQVIHHHSYPASLNHGLHSHPAGLFKLGDCGRALARRDAATGIDIRAVNVVGAEDVLLSSCMQALDDELYLF